MDIGLEKLRQVVRDVESGSINDPETINIELKVWEIIHSWAVLEREAMELVLDKGPAVDRDSPLIKGYLGIERFDHWRANPAKLMAERDEMIDDLTELEKLLAELKDLQIDKLI